MNLKRVFLSLALLAVTCLAAAKPAAADSVLYDDGAPQNTWLSSGSNGGGPIYDCVSMYSTYTAASSFSLAANSTVTGFDFYAQTRGNPVETFSWAIAGTPGGAPLASGTIANPNQTQVGETVPWRSGNIFSSVYAAGATQPLSALVEPVYSVDASHALSLSLASGTYYLELSDGFAIAPSYNNYPGVFLMKSFGTSDTYRGSSGIYTDMSGGNGTAFTIYGSVNSSDSGGTPQGGGSGLPSSVVPEPPSVTLLGLGLITLLAAGLFRKFNTPATADGMIA